MASARLSVTGAPRRLDRFLRDALGEPHGRRAVAALIRSGAVRVNGRVATKSTVVTAGDAITVETDGAPALQPVAMALAIVHCDDDVVAVDKPPAMPSTAGPSGRPSVAAALLHRFPEMAAIDARRAAGLVHRLDTGTSGLLVAARTPGVYARLRAAFAAKTIVKDYLAIVQGEIRSAGAVAVPLARKPRSRRRMVVAPAGRGWDAETAYRPLATARDLTLVALRMRTGVTHQLRVHMAHIGHPVLGDRRYGAAAPLAAGDDAGWHYLHALRIEAERGELPRVLTTAFPAHWRPLCERLGWPPDVPQPW